jgi:hypothetical protein
VFYQIFGPFFGVIAGLFFITKGGPYPKGIGFIVRAVFIASPIMYSAMLLIFANSNAETAKSALAMLEDIPDLVGVSAHIHRLALAHHANHLFLMAASVSSFSAAVTLLYSIIRIFWCIFLIEKINSWIKVKSIGDLFVGCFAGALLLISGGYLFFYFEPDAASLRIGSYFGVLSFSVRYAGLLFFVDAVGFPLFGLILAIREKLRRLGG